MTTVNCVQLRCTMRFDYSGHGGSMSVTVVSLTPGGHHDGGGGGGGRLVEDS